MSRREFTKVSPNLWRSKRLRSVPIRAQLLYCFLLTCEHQNSTGCFRLPDGYACADLGWEPIDYTTARGELIDVDLIAYDEALSLIYIRRWFRHSPPMNPKHAQGTVSQIGEIESDRLREIVEEEFAEANGLVAMKSNLADTLKRSRATGERA